MVFLTTNTMTILRPHQLDRAALEYCYIFVGYTNNTSNVYIKDQSQDSIMHTRQLLQVCRDSYVDHQTGNHPVYLRNRVKQSLE